MLAALTANVHRDSKTRPFTSTDFMPKFGPPPTAEQEIAAISGGFAQLASQQAGKDLDG